MSENSISSAPRKSRVSDAFADFKKEQKDIGTSSPILPKVRSIVADKLGVEPYQVVECASFTKNLGADSLDAVELIMEFEKEFGIEIPDEDAESILTVGDAVRYIENNM